MCKLSHVRKQVAIVPISVDAHDLMDKVSRTIGQQSDINLNSIKIYLLPKVCPESIFVKDDDSLTWDLSSVFSSKKSLVLPSTVSAGDTL